MVRISLRLRRIRKGSARTCDVYSPRFIKDDESWPDTDNSDTHRLGKQRLLLPTNDQVDLNIREHNPGAGDDKAIVDLKIFNMLV